MPNVSRGIQDKLQKYVDLLLKWNKKINLISKNTEVDVWNRHIEDSMQLSEYLPKEGVVVDVGSGAGLPGVVLAVLGYDITLVECDSRKVCFLREIVRSLGLDVSIVEERVENISAETGVVVCRGFASVEKILEVTQGIECDRFLLLKGKNLDTELLDAKKEWIFDCKKYRSITSVESCVLEITNAKKKA